jgi:hypothetical protein
MPLLTQSNVGGISVIPSNVNLRRQGTVVTGGGLADNFTSPILFVNGLPQLQLWTQQDALSAGLSCTATLEFSVRQVGGTEEWLTLAQFAIPAAGVPGLFAFVMPCNAIRLRIDGSAGWARDVTVDYVLAAFGP